MRWALIACGFAALAACHDLPDLGRCGNNIVEQGNGEACDDGRETSTCTATCKLKCTSEAVTASYVAVGTNTSGATVYCPGASYQCGLDAVCSAPSGKFAQLTAALPFDVSGPPVIGDVNNDHFPDLVGTSETNIYVRFGNTDTPLDEVVIQEAPFSDAPYAIFNLPADRPDKTQPGTMIAIPTEGVALLRSDGDRFIPQLDLPLKDLNTIIGNVGSPIEAIETIQGLIVRDPDPTIGDVVMLVPGKSVTKNAIIRVVRVPIGQAPDPLKSPPPCVGSGSQPWRTVDLKAAPDRKSFVVVTQREGATQPWHVCRYAYSGTTWALSADFEVSSPAPSSIMLANLDASDACLDLVVQGSGAPGLGKIDASGAGCGFALPVTPLPIDGMGSKLLAAGQLVPNGADELLLTDGVYRSCTSPADCGVRATGTFMRVAAPTPPSMWTAAAVVDLNGDGVLDAVAGRGHEAAPGAMPGRDPDIDIVRGGEVPNVYRANTSEPVTSLVAGDFDGDRLGDVAMIESAPPGDQVTVLFGTREATAGTPIAMSRFGGKLRIDRLSEVHWLPSRGSDGIDDLLVIDSSMNPAAGLLLGDAARLMTTPRFPMNAVVGGPPLGAVAAGTFGSDNLELLALTGTQAQLYNVMANGWAPSLDVGMQLNQPVGALRDGPSRTRGAARGSGDRDVVVFSMRGAFTMCQVTASGAVRDLRGIDIDGDGVDELAVFSDDSQGKRTLQLFRSAGCPLAPVLVDELARCVDVVSAGNSLVAICRDSDSGVITPSGAVDPAARDLVKITTTGGQPVITPLRTVDGDARFVTAGDFDGDGVPDIAVGVHRASGVNVQLLRQCPAHDTRTCQLPP